VIICGGLVLLLYHPESEPDFVLVPLAIFLFPDGRLPSPRWRRVVGGSPDARGGYGGFGGGTHTSTCIPAVGNAISKSAYTRC
jgi:hypothetical protein